VVTANFTPARQGRANRNVAHRTPAVTTHRVADHSFVLTLFFTSGVAGLIYEIVWSRSLGLILGHTSHASATVLTGYFAGMAIGYWIGTRWLRYFSRPLMLYGILEIVAGAWAWLLPNLLSGLTGTIGDNAARALPGGYALLAVALLLPATISLGATLPAMAKHLSVHQAVAGQAVAFAYGLNTLGGLAGVLLATFVLINLLGVAATNGLAASLSMLCGLAACAHSHGLPPVDEVGETQPLPSRLRLSWLCMAGGSGLVTLLLQVAFVRQFALVFHNSTYTFGIVVAVYLLGLALGSVIVSRWLSSVEPARVLVVSCLLSAALLAISPWIFVALTELKYFRAGNSLLGHMLAAGALVGAVVLLPVVALGTLLPTIWRLVAQQLPADGLAVTVGRLTAVNTLLAAMGAWLASFVVLPSVGLYGTWMLAVGLLVLFGIYHAQRRSLPLVVAAACLAATSFTAGLPYRAAIPQGAELVNRWESGFGWIELLRRPFDGVQLLRQDVQYGLGTDLDVDWERRQGYLPLLLHPKPKEVAFLGIGTGISVSAFVPLSQVERVDAVELIPDVVKALPYFDAVNLKFYADPRCTVHQDDARHFMHRTAAEYDVIISDLFTPWHSQTGYLYTVEHFRNCQARLHAGGIYCQWIPMWQLGKREFEMIADSFRSVFPRTTLWWSLLEPGKPLLCLIGSDEPLILSEAVLSQPIDKLAQASELADPYVASLRRISHLFIGSWPKRYNCQLNTDDRPFIEFWAPGSDLQETKLRDGEIQSYFEEVLTRLPQDGLRVVADARPLPIIDRIRWQHAQLATPVSRGRIQPPAPKFLDESGDP